mmetsp:Transcript_86102/g.174827  ORF Transcript_86102/g.174827 Transcript_86102/m.174827 type:complete len:87 (+) Transcript_86102:273-533(+)
MYLNNALQIKSNNNSGNKNRSRNVSSTNQGGNSNRNSGKSNSRSSGKGNTNYIPCDKWLKMTDEEKAAQKAKYSKSKASKRLQRLC